MWPSFALMVILYCMKKAGIYRKFYSKSVAKISKHFKRCRETSVLNKMVKTFIYVQKEIQSWKENKDKKLSIRT